MSRSSLCVRLWRLVAAGLAGGLLAACAQPLIVGPANGGAAPEFAVAVDKPGDRMTVTADADRTIFDVWSPSGIGSAGVRLAAGDMPPSVVMRFHLRGLEQMTFSYGDTIVTLSVPSGGDAPVLQSVLQAGQEQSIGPESPYWMEVVQMEPSDGSDGGYFQVTAPQAFSTSPATNFTMGWIDFYR